MSTEAEGHGSAPGQTRAGRSAAQGPSAAGFSGETRLLLVLGLTLWLVSGLSQVWEVLAAQSPDSPFHFGVLTGPVAQLRATSFGMGAMCMGLAWGWGAWFGPGQGRVILGLFLLGVALETAALWIAAARGLLAVQFFDPRPDAQVLLVLRAVGHGLCLASGVALLIKAIRSLRHHPVG
jgi:hypothetical protein